MKLITVSGPPASGKTSVLSKLISQMTADGLHVGVVKFDCLQTEDDQIFEKLGIPAIKGLSAELCPDHYFVSNIEEAVQWGEERGLDYLFSESAGLCNRCSPHIKDIPAICVIDQLSGIHAPKKIGPMLRLADLILITKGDIVSQAEREVFYRNVQLMNPSAGIFHVNGLTGQGIYEVLRLLTKIPEKKASVKEEKSSASEEIKNKTLRFPMPMAMCAYCLGETKIGREYQVGNRKKISV